MTDERTITRGEQLRAWREARGLLQTQLAALLGVTSNSIARWERGEVAPVHPRMLWLALTALDLLGLAKAPTPDDDTTRTP